MPNQYPLGSSGLTLLGSKLKNAYAGVKGFFNNMKGDTSALNQFTQASPTPQAPATPLTTSNPVIQGLTPKAYSPVKPGGGLVSNVSTNAPQTSTGQQINPATGGISKPTTPSAPVNLATAPNTGDVAQPSTAPPTTPPTAPSTPSISPEQKSVNDALMAFMANAGISPEEIKTQEDLDQLTESFKQGYQNIEDQTIPMNFITGQQASLEKRALNMAEPLSNKLARLQAKRKSALEVSKFGLERADKALESKTTATTKAAEAEESARRFGIEQAGSAETRALSRQTAEATQKQADRKFEEDKRQFGLEYALKARETAVAEAKARAETATGLTNESGQALQLVNNLIPKVGEIAGIIRTGFATGSKSELKQLISTLSLNARKLIKGSGAVSDFEAKMLQDSSTALSSGRLSEKFVEKELKKVRGVINSNAGIPVEVEVVSPKGESYTASLSRDEIYRLASEGNILNYK